MSFGDGNEAEAEVRGTVCRACDGPAWLALV